MLRATLGVRDRRNRVMVRVIIGAIVSISFSVRVSGRVVGASLYKAWGL